MEARLAYNYALVDETGWCYEVTSTSRSHAGESGWIAIPDYDLGYIEKYYNVANGKWYEDADFTIEWSPS